MRRTIAQATFASLHRKVYMFFQLIFLKCSKARRRRYKPKKVRVLFVGESPPASGQFFYSDETALHTATRAAFASFFKKKPLGFSQFLKLFKDAGCYLEDLCWRPVNHWSSARRRLARKTGVPRLHDKIRDLRPAAVICVMKGIAPLVRKALPDPSVPFLALPFPSRPVARANYISGLRRELTTLKKKGVL
jgi:hypothetical protein